MREIRTERLWLRHPILADAAALHPLYADAEVMRYGSRPPHTDMAQTMAILEKTIAGNAEGSCDFYNVFLGDDLTGGAGIWQQEEIGFSFLPRFWGTGIAFEAVTAVIADQQQRGRQRLTADVDPRNERSLAFMKKLGFTVTGQEKNTWQVGGVWTDSVYLERLL